VSGGAAIAAAPPAVDGGLHHAAVRRLPLAPIAYAVLLASMAGAQLSDVPGFSELLRAYDLPTQAARGIAVLAIVAEGGAAAGLVLAHARPRLGLGVAAGALGLVVALAWLLIGAQALLRDLDVANAAFLGVRAGIELTAWILLVNVAALALALAAWRQLPRSAPRARARASQPS
jgi:hypothetical protein